MPDLRVECAAREQVEARALCDGDVGDEQTGVVLRHVLMDGCGQDSEVAVEEENHQEGEDRRRGDLDNGANLI